MEFTFTAPEKAGKFPAEIADLIRLAEDPQMLEGIGTALASLTRRSIDEPDLRPSPWAPRKNQRGLLRLR